MSFCFCHIHFFLLFPPPFFHFSYFLTIGCCCISVLLRVPEQLSLSPSFLLPTFPILSVILLSLSLSLCHFVSLSLYLYVTLVCVSLSLCLSPSVSLCLSLPISFSLSIVFGCSPPPPPPPSSTCTFSHASLTLNTSIFPLSIFINNPVTQSCLFAIYQNCPHGRPTMRHLFNLNMMPD